MLDKTCAIHSIGCSAGHSIGASLIMDLGDGNAGRQPL